jgi:hypothetical protein
MHQSITLQHLGLRRLALHHLVFILAKILPLLVLEVRRSPIQCLHPPFLISMIINKKGLTYQTSSKVSLVPAPPNRIPN